MEEERIKKEKLSNIFVTCYLINTFGAFSRVVTAHEKEYRNGKRNGVHKIVKLKIDVKIIY